MKTRPSTLLMAFIAAVFLTAQAQSAEMPQTLPTRVAISKEIRPVPWTAVSEFLPPRAGTGNAAEHYAKAASLIRQVPRFPTLPIDRAASRANQSLQSALNEAFEGSLCRQADFLKLYTYRSWEPNGTPDLLAAIVIAKALGRSAAWFLDEADTAKALASAQAAISMGEHYRAGAPTLAQSLAAEEMIHEGLRSIRAVYARMGDKTKAKLAAECAAGISNLSVALEARSAAMAVGWQTPEVILRALRDPEPVIRADALLLIELAYDPTGSQKLIQDPKIQPLIVMLRNDKKVVQEAIAKLLQDPNPMVKSIAERIISQSLSR